MGPAQAVGQVFFPLDEELALQPGSLTPRQQEHLAHLATWMPFERAAQMLDRLLGVQVSEPTVRRGTLRAGALYAARQTAQSQQPTPAELTTVSAEKQVISTDGAYVPLVAGAWAEVRTVAIGEVTEAITGAGQREVPTCHLSYFSRMTDAETFGDVAQVEMQRRGVSQAKAVCAVTDGADWIQGFVDLHRPDAVRILDFPRPGLLLRWCDRLPAALTELESVQKQVHYFRKREALLQYPVYQQQGWPIGSGMVESANKVVVQARLKGAGMHWEPAHVNPMLALRTAACSERWDEAWQDTVQQQRSQLSTERQQLATTRFQSQLASLLLLLLRFCPTPPKPVPPSLHSAHPAATLPGSCRPSPSDPWKRAPTCRPKLSAKK